MKEIKRKHGWLRDALDQRDIMFTPNELKVTGDIDLSAGYPAIFDQKQIGSCVSNAAVANMMFEMKKQGLPVVMLSRLFAYYEARAIEGTTKQDAGCSIRDMYKVISKYGACPESEWAYTTANVTKKPTAKVLTDALPNIVTQYLSVKQDLVDIKNCLAQGYPITIGISVYDSFESAAVAASGIVPMPAKNEQLLGGHGVDICGDLPEQSRFLCRNSWGKWGMNNSGYFTLPYAYVISTKLASDFWTIRLIK